MKYEEIRRMDDLKVGEAMVMEMGYKALRTLRVKISVIRRKGVRDYCSTQLVEREDGTYVVRVERVK